MIQTTLRYVPDLPRYYKETLYELWVREEEIPEGLEKTNVQWKEFPNIPIKNLRANQVDLGLESSGFLWEHFPSDALPKLENSGDGLGTTVTVNPDSVKAYLEETIEFLKKSTGCKTVLINDWRYRSGTIERAFSRDPTDDIVGVTSSDRTQSSPLATQVHIDNSELGGPMRLSRIFSEAEQMKYNSPGTYIQMINVWRPMVPVVKNAPLAVCDMRTVRAEEILPVDKVTMTHLNQGAYPKFNAQHEWYYLSDQTSEEVLVFLTYDSRRKGLTPGVPHATCDIDPTERQFLRSSIEVRVVTIGHEGVN